MFKPDEDILRTYFKLEEYQRQRLWLERLLHPENFKWSKGLPPPITNTKKIRIEVLASMGFGEVYYQRMLDGEQEAKSVITRLVHEHVLWEHIQHIKGFGEYLTGAFIAAGGDITRTPTVSSFWKGMGLDVLANGTVPRRIRGKKDVERRMPALPHVTRIGEQIRQQTLRSNGKLRERYDHYREYYDGKYPDRQKLFNHKAALRAAQKILYGCLWKAWREGYHLPAPAPYAFDILKHDDGSLIRIEDLYDD